MAFRTGNHQFGLSPGSQFLNYMSASMDLTARNLVATQMKASGATWVRVDCPWYTVWNGSAFDFTSLDLQVLPFTSAGMKVMLILMNPVGSSDSVRVTPSIPDWTAYVTAVVNHYLPHGIHTYEVFNEPNYDKCGLAGASGAARATLWTSLLQAAYTTIKALDPASFVVTGGLAPPAVADGADGGGSTGTNLSPLSFLTAAYAAGMHGYFDAVGMHPYSWPNTLLSDALSWNQFAHLQAIRDLMVANGDASKSIWLTEFGSTVSPDPTLYGYIYGFTEIERIQMMRDVYRQALTWTWIGGPIFHFNWVDTSIGTFGIAMPTADGFTAHTGLQGGSMFLNGALTSGVEITSIGIRATSRVVRIPAGETISLTTGGTTQTTTLSTAYTSSLTANTTMTVSAWTPSTTYADYNVVKATVTTPAAGTPANYTMASTRAIYSALPAVIQAKG